MVAPLSWPAGYTARGRPDYSGPLPFPGGTTGATVRIQRYLATAVGPHGETQRATYLPGAARAAILDHVLLMVRRRTSATTVGPVRGWLRIDADGLTDIPLAIARLETNGVGDFTAVHTGPLGVAINLDQVELVTQDDSTGGSVDYDLVLKLLEFDY